jgi:hypothetical protein
MLAGLAVLRCVAPVPERLGCIGSWRFSFFGIRMTSITEIDTYDPILALNVL